MGAKPSICNPTCIVRMFGISLFYGVWDSVPLTYHPAVISLGLMAFICVGPHKSGCNPHYVAKRVSRVSRALQQQASEVKPEGRGHPRGGSTC